MNLAPLDANFPRGDKKNRKKGEYAAESQTVEPCALLFKLLLVGLVFVLFLFLSLVSFRGQNDSSFAVFPTDSQPYPKEGNFWKLFEIPRYPTAVAITNCSLPLRIATGRMGTGTGWGDRLRRDILLVMLGYSDMEVKIEHDRDRI